MSRNGKVVVAMSGGVDSSVVACLLKEQGYECVGVFMRVGVEHPAETETCAVTPAHGTDATNATVGAGLPDASPPRRRFKHGCCSASDAIDARTVAGRLGIPFYALNFRRDFEEIIDYFVDEYSHARTPNPCVMCNIKLKFGRLLRYADAMDTQFIATGHYARVVKRDSVHCLAPSLNRAKDQSYVLFGLRREDLPRCMFPIGEITDKSQVRKIAADLGLSVHDKPDSQEICFVPENDYAKLVHDRRPQTFQPGDVRDATGRLLGQHEGISSYTIGQRRGLRLAVGSPIYVTRLDAETNTVTVGPRENLLASGLLAERVNWLVDPPCREIPAHIKIRHMHSPAAGRIEALPNGSVRASFDQPQSAVTPGQAAVFYANDVVLGGGWILSAAPSPHDQIDAALAQSAPA